MDDATSSDLYQIMTEQSATMDKLPEDSFKRIYWNQQMEAAKKHRNGMRWHPLMIRWCLYLRHLSSKAYDSLRETGCIHLPSQRTLCDYSHCIESGTGFSTEVDQHLLNAAKLESSPDWHRLLVLLMDEMYVKESLVYDKHTGKMIGFTDLGDVNNCLISLEQALSSEVEQDPPLARSMMVFMVRGIFTSFQYIYAQFPCSTLTGDLIFDPFWESIFRLERMGFKVTAWLFCITVVTFTSTSDTKHYTNFII